MGAKLCARSRAPRAPVRSLHGAPAAIRARREIGRVRSHVEIVRQPAANVGGRLNYLPLGGQTARGERNLAASKPIWRGNCAGGDRTACKAPPTRGDIPKGSLCALCPPSFGCA